MPASRTRIGGLTSFSWQGSVLAWAQTVQDTAPAPVAAAQAIQPLDQIHPVEIVTAQAVGAGTLRLTMYELWNGPIWQQLPGLGNAATLLDVLTTQISLGNVSCRKIISKPDGTYRTKVYLNCVITDADDGESITISTMTLPKTLTLQYTQYTMQ
jgi:hypothetical protein